MRFEVLTAVSGEITLYSDVGLCIPVNVYQSFGGTPRRHLQGKSIGNKEAVHFAEVSLNYWQIIRRHIPVTI